MKKTLLFFILATALTIASGCSSWDKAKNKVKGISASDVSKISDLINMDFGKGPDGPFEVTKIASAKPELVIDNQTDRTIKVVTSGSTAKTITGNSKQKQTVTVNSGNHHFDATAKGTKGCSGDVELKGFNRYTWVFYIK